MVLDFPYKEFDVVTIYEDWERQEKPLGTAQLLKFIKQGRSFILEDTYPEIEQKTYNWQEWRVQFWDDELNSWTTPAKIRYLDTIGIANSADDEEYDSTEDPKLQKDSFIIFNGIQIY